MTTPRSMTPAQKYERARAIAERVQIMMKDRAKRIFRDAFGFGGAHYECFHLAHNWQDLPDLTRAQRRACRIVLRIQEKQWAPMDIARSLYYRTSK